MFHRRLVAPAILLFTLSLLVQALRVAASPSYLSDYESGHRALRYSSWDEAAFWFSRAMEKRPEDGGKPGRKSGRNFVPYLPHYFLGLALFQGGRYSEALEAWTEAERRWETESWLTQSKGLLEYRKSLDSHRERYEKEILPKAKGDLDSYLHGLRATIQRLNEQPVPRAAAEIAAVEARLPEWEERAATTPSSYREVIALTREIVETLDRLEVIEDCAGPGANEPWCNPETPAPVSGRKFPTYRPLSRLASNSVANSLITSVPVRDQDRERIKKLYGKKCALLISPSYSRWEPIPDAAPKIKRLGEALTGLGFKVEILAKPLSKDDVEFSIRRFIEDNAPIVSSQPSLLLVHFIGHGYLLNAGGARMGLLVTSSTPDSKASAALIARQAVFEGYFQQFVARPMHHIVFTFETCASGRFLDELSGANPKDWRKAVGNPVFLVLTAGDVDEVGSLRKLPLTEELTKVFSGCGQGGKPSVRSGFMILEGVRRTLMTLYPSRNPQLRKSLFQRHREGDFVLFIPDHCLAA